MSPAPMEQNQKLEKRSSDEKKRRRFANLRSVQWRVDLAILPFPSSSSSSSPSSSSSSSSIDDLRRATADSRRRYASMRRRLLVDPHLPKDGSNSPDLVMDNPLSQNPDSTWGRFFRNAELEKMVDQDLSRLYPEHGSYFQTPGCQGMLRRILLLWCLRHPEFGYRQGMHELLAPLLYVLHVDVERFSEVRKLYEDHFTDKFDGLSYHENDLTYNFDIKRFLDPMDDDVGSSDNAVKVRSLDELDPEIQTIVLLTDAYGAEGELGIVLSEKFMEHDAYCMFEALMSGNHCSVAMADFFAPSPTGGLHTGLSPVIEASAALYHLLSVVDSSLHSHLVELGVEPQYFALRWLRVLFGREFSLDDLLIVWDEIFAADNGKTHKGVEDESGSSFGILSSPRGALISAMAVSMMLYLRSSLLATENATSCLQRLLNFPENIILRKIVEKAKSLQVLALDVNISSSHHSFSGAHGRSRSMDMRSHTLSSDSLSPKTPLSMVPDSYWEEKWRVLHKAEQLRQSNSGNEKRTSKKGWTEKVRFSLSRTESDPSPAKARRGEKESKSSVRRNLLEDLSRQLGLDEDVEKVDSHEVLSQEHPTAEVEVEGESGLNKDFTCISGERCFNGNAGSEENSSIFSDPPSPVSGVNDHENGSEKSSVASNISLDENDDHSKTVHVDPPVPISFPPDSISQNSDGVSSYAVDSISQKSDSGSQNSDTDSRSSQCNTDSTGNSVAGAKERKLSKFHWFWKFGRNATGEETSQKGGSAIEATKSANDESNQGYTVGSSIADVSRNSVASSNGMGDTVDQNVMGTFKNLGQSMLEHIQVIESVFQQDRGQVGSLESLSKNVLVGKGQVTAMTALSELRKISNLLSEM